MRVLNLIWSIILWLSCYGEITDKQYANSPVVFYNDNYDHCMLRGDEAFYCFFTYELHPLDPSNTTELWKTIEELSSSELNYRHDRLRHAICLPETCPNFNANGDITKEINRCYDEKFRQKHLRGIVSEVHCETNKSSHPIDWFDVLVGLLFAVYLPFVVYASIKESSSSKSSKDQLKFVSTTKGKILSAFSVPRNWKRLTEVKNDDSQLWRAIQGVRVYNIILVIVVHTVLLYISGPIANTKFVENVQQKVLTLFLASGSLALGTNFFLSTFLLTQGIYSQLEGKEFKFSLVSFLFISRIIRVIPTLLVLILFVSTWLRHLGDGPYWNFFVIREVQYCRRNGWLNLLFINSIFQSDEMCIPLTWYLAQDTQFFLLSLILIWMFKKNHKLMWPTLITLIVFCTTAVFIYNYSWDFEAIIYPKPESDYYLKSIRGNPQWYGQMLNIYGNPISSLLGIAAGYGYYLNQKNSFFEKYKRFFAENFNKIAYGLGLGTVLAPGILSLHLGMAHSRFWASLYTALGRLFFTFGVSGALILCTLGIGGLTKKIVEWSPTFILGRLSYSAYLAHFPVIILRHCVARFPLYASDYAILIMAASDIALTYLAALVLTLLVELPVSDLQKVMLPTKSKVPNNKNGFVEKRTNEHPVNGLKKD